MPIPNMMIAGRFRHYSQLIEELKTPLNNPVVLSVNPNHTSRLAGTVELSSRVDTNVHLVAEKSRRSASHYGLKIHARNLCPHPIIRFEADGPRHYNPLDDVPLGERHVDTPHFHRFNERGIEFAYLTDELRDPFLVGYVQRDFDYGLEYFCLEGRIMSSPSLKFIATQLEFPQEEYDPLAGVRFQQ